jgi:hypothetical protein
MKINIKNTTMLLISALFLVFSLIIVSPNASHSDSIAPPLESVVHSQQLNTDSVAIVQLDHKQAKLFTEVTQIGSPDCVANNRAHYDLSILRPFYINIAGDDFGQAVLENYQYIVQIYLSHQQFVWHTIKSQGLIKPSIQQYEPLDLRSNSIFA